MYIYNLIKFDFFFFETKHVVIVNTKQNFTKIDFIIT